MELNLKNIQQLNSQQILEIIKPMVNNLYKLIDYVGITKENYYDLILKEIKKSKKIILVMLHIWIILKIK